MCKVCTEAVHSVALWTRVTLQVWTCVKYVPKQSIAQRFEHVCKCKRMSSSPPHPTPPYPMWCVCGWMWVERMMQDFFRGVLVTPVCVRGWLWKMAVCARDSSLCARVTLGGKNDAKLCLCVLVTPECVRGWPPDLSRCNVSFREGKPSKQQSKFCSQGHVWPLRDCTAPLEQRSASQYQRRWWNCYWFGLSLSWNLDLLTWFAFFVHVVSLAWSIFCETVIYCRPSLTK